MPLDTWGFVIVVAVLGVIWLVIKGDNDEDDPDAPA